MEETKAFDFGIIHLPAGWRTFVDPTFETNKLDIMAFCSRMMDLHDPNVKDA